MSNEKESAKKNLLPMSCSCFFVQYRPRKEIDGVEHFDGVLRYTPDNPRIKASADLYEHPSKVQAGQVPFPKHCKKLPEGMPVFPRDTYRFFFEVQQISEGCPDKSVSLRFQVYEYDAGSKRFSHRGGRSAILTQHAPEKGMRIPFLVGNVFDERTSEPVGELRLSLVSDKFVREAVVQLDSDGKIPLPFKNGKGDRDWDMVFRECDWSVRTDPAKPPPTAPVPDEKVLTRSWTDAELHEKMQKRRGNPAQAESEWRYHLLCVGTFANPQYERGVMYDVGGSDLNESPREGAAIAAGWSLAAWSQEWQQVEAQLPSKFSAGDLVDLPSLANKLKKPSRPFDTWLARELSQATKTALERYHGQESDPAPLQEALLQDLNRILLSGVSIFDEERFAGITLNSATQTWMSQKPQRSDLQQLRLQHLNGLLIQNAYPLEVSKGHFYQAEDLYFRTAVHEIGHALGLGHSHEGTQFMNTTDALETLARTQTKETKLIKAEADKDELFARVQANALAKASADSATIDELRAVQTAAKTKSNDAEIKLGQVQFPSNIEWRFSDADLDRLQHGPDVMVRSGTFVEGGLAGFGDNEMAWADGLELQLTPLLQSVPLGALVRVRLTLRNGSAREQEVPGTLHLKGGFVEGTVFGPGGHPARPFYPVMRCMDSDRVQKLKPGETLHHSLTLLRGHEGPLFRGHGDHRIRVRVSWHREGKPVYLENETWVRVEAATDMAHQMAASNLLNSPDTLLGLALGKDLGKDDSTIRAAIDACLEVPVLRSHYEVLRLKWLLWASPPKLVEALEKLKGGGVMSISEANTLLQALDEVVKVDRDSVAQVLKTELQQKKDALERAEG